MTRARRSCALMLPAMLVVLGFYAAPPALGDEHYIRSRLVHRFDFEESDDGNFENLPMHWWVMGRDPQTNDPTFLRFPLHKKLVERQGYPSYTEVSFDRPQHDPGEHAFALLVNGGNVGAFIEVGTIPAVPGSDYLITAKVRTAQLQHAAARLSAYFIDVQGERIEASVRVVADIRTDGQWQTISLPLRGDFAAAAWLGLELEVLQPVPDPDSPLGEHEVVYKDVLGGAWFDDVTIWQMPRVTIRTQSPVNIVRAPQRPTLALEVRDLTGRSLVADVSVYDHERTLVAQARQYISRQDPTTWKWTPPLTKLGWYVVDLRVHETEHDEADGGGAGAGRAARGAANVSADTDMPADVARAIGAVLWLGESAPLRHAEGRQFVLDARGVSEAQLLLLPQVMDATGLSSAILSAWDEGVTPANLAARLAKLDGVVTAVLQRGGELTMTLDPVPDTLVESFGNEARAPMALFRQPFDNYQPYLAPVLRHYGQRVRQWQLGDPRTARAFADADLPQFVQNVAEDFATLAPQPRLMLPWRASQPRREGMSARAAYSIDVSPAVMPQQIAAHVQEFADDPATPFVLHLRTLDATQLVQRRRMTDLALRMLEAWRTRPAALALRQPWDVTRQREMTLVPDPLLGVFATMAHRLSARQYVGRMPVTEGIEAMIFDAAPNGGAGMLAVWNRHAPPDDAVLDMYLGREPRAYDLFGNELPIIERDGRHRLPIGDAPIFIEGIDANLALFRAAFRLEPPFIESRQTAHTRTITITNPWRTTLSGTMVIIDPVKWEITPRLHQISLAAGETVTLPVTMMFPVSELAGDKELVARFDIMTEQRYRVDLSAPMQVGLPHVKFDANLALQTGASPGQSDLVVTQLITNTGDEPLAMYAFANFTGHPRQERIISQLKPGQSAIRRFVFQNVDPATATQQRMRVGLRETSGPAVLNQLLTLDGQ